MAAEADKKEYFAQIYTYKQLENEGETAAITAMELLTDQQPHIYETYCSATPQDVAAINASLLEARRHGPTGCEAYSQAISTAWRFHFSNLQRYHEPFVGYILMHAGTNSKARSAGPGLRAKKRGGLKVRDYFEPGF